MEKNRKINIALTLIGIVFFIAGIVGLAIPVVPQVPFFLVSIGCFARGCPPIHRRIRSTKLYKKVLGPYESGEKRISFREIAIALSVTMISCVAVVLIRVFLFPEAED